MDWLINRSNGLLIPYPAGFLSNVRLETYSFILFTF